MVLAIVALGVLTAQGRMQPSGSNVDEFEATVLGSHRAAITVAGGTAAASPDAHTSCSFPSQGGRLTCESWAPGQRYRLEDGRTASGASPVIAQSPPSGAHPTPDRQTLTSVSASIAANRSVWHSSQLPLFVDVQAVAYSMPPPSSAPPRNATVASIVSGAANHHNVSADEIVAMAVAAQKASRDQLDVVLFPECFMYNGDNAEACGVGDGPAGERWRCQGPHVTACRRVALATKAYVVCPFYELANETSSQDTGPSFNTAVLLDRDGVVVGKYRKSYPTSEIFPRNTGELSEGILPGNLGVPVFDTDFGRVAILICWDFDFPELWYAAAAGGAELVLWPSAGKGGQNVAVHAQTHNIFVAANGNGQFWDRLGKIATPSAAFNYTLARHGTTARPHGSEILISVATLDLDSSLIFFGGPRAKKQAIESFLQDAEKHGVVSVYKDDIANIELLACVQFGCRSRAALKEAGIETRREERNRNRLSNNRLRAMDVP